jgi:hypothetical protein
MNSDMAGKSSLRVVKTDHGVVDDPDFPTLLQQVRQTIAFIEIVNPDGSSLTFGSRTSNKGLRWQYLRIRQTDGTDLWSSRVTNQPNVLNLLERFYRTGERLVPGQPILFAFNLNDGLRFDHESEPFSTGAQRISPRLVVQQQETALAPRRARLDVILLTVCAAIFIIAAWIQLTQERRDESPPKTLLPIAIVDAAMTATTAVHSLFERPTEQRSVENPGSLVATEATPGSPGYVQTNSNFTALKHLLETKTVQFTRGGMEGSERIANVSQSNGMLSYIQVLLVSTKDGDYTTRATYTVPLGTVDFARSRVEAISENDRVTYKLVVPTVEDRETITTEVFGFGSGFYSANTMKSVERHAISEFGFAFNNAAEAERTKTMINAMFAPSERPQFTTTSNHEPTSLSPSESARVILGSRKDQVDTILTGWTVRHSNRSAAVAPLFYYGKDVEMIVKFRADRAISVAVIDRPGVGASPISPGRYAELTNLIGGVPLVRDIIRDATGIREFSVGDAD